MSPLLDGVELVDHHCHGVLRTDVGQVAFETHLTEADGPGPWHGSLFDTRAGLAVRARCAPLLDLPAHASAEDYLARRAELGHAEVGRRMLATTGTTTFCVDTGYLPDQLTSPPELAALAGPATSAHEVVRLEPVAEQVIAVTGPTGFAAALRTAVGERTRGAVAVKSIAAYRTGLDLDPARPGDAEVDAAATAWVSAIDGGAPARLVDPVLVRALLWTAVDLRLPVQLHVGYGDADVDLHRCDPLLLTPLLRATAGLGVPFLLLHTYPFQRSAGYLAQVFDHVFVDVGLAVQNVGSRAGAVLAELTELAPFGSVLFSSDACALPELYAVSTALFRESLTRLLEGGVADGSWGAADAERLAVMVASGNARRAYRLDER